MKHGSLLCFGVVLVLALGLSLGSSPLAAQAPAKPGLGALTVHVRDAAGVPQLGASVQLVSEIPGLTASYQFLTNTNGSFSSEKVLPGIYTVRVTLAGYLPSVEKHIRIASNLSTAVRVELESMFATLEQLRRPPSGSPSDADEWKSVLRAGAGLRPILQWNEDDPAGARPVAFVVENHQFRPKARVEWTEGSRRPGSISNLSAAPATMFAYDQRIDGSNHVVFAGQASYDGESPAGGIAAVWLPAGSYATGSRSVIVFREAKIGTDGPVFRGGRLDQSTTLSLGDRVLLRAGGEYVFVGVASTASALRPRINLETRIADEWYGNLIYAAIPVGGQVLDAEHYASEIPSTLSSALNELDAFPALLWRRNRPVLEDGRHEEVNLEHKLGSKGSLQFAAFHDNNSHVALFATGNSLPSAEYFQDFYSKGFAYDGGASNSWGGRVALREKLSEDIELTAVYSIGGALVPATGIESTPHDILRTERKNSVAASMSAKVPKAGTKVTVGYKWVEGNPISRVDPYGESLYQLNPYLHVGVRQPLPRFLLGRWEAVAECDNILAQGYRPLNTVDGPLVVVPAFRSFRGGLSLQF